MSNFHGSTLRSAFLGPGNSSVFRSEAVKAVAYHTKDSKRFVPGVSLWWQQKEQLPLAAPEAQTVAVAPWAWGRPALACHRPDMGDMAWKMLRTVSFLGTFGNYDFDPF